MTKHNVALLELFAADPTREWYGLEIADELGMASGVLYPALHRWHADGLLTRREEDVDPREEGRPRRRIYRLTAAGEALAYERRVTVPRRLPARRDPRD